MSVSIQRLIAGTSVLALLIVVSSASAAVSLGYPAERPYYGASRHSMNSHAHRSYAPVYSTESRQSFSYEPADNSADVHKSNAESQATPQAAQKDTPKEHVAVAPQTTTRQSFSYEPARQRRSSARRSAHREAWQYQKTDARRGN